MDFARSEEGKRSKGYRMRKKYHPEELDHESAALSAEQVRARKMRDYGEASWGPWLFTGTFVACLAFVWWLTIAPK